MSVSYKNMTDSFKVDRKHQILESVQINGSVSVEELCKQFRASAPTIRRDLRELAKMGLVIRAHGGAVAVQPSQPEPPVIQRMNVSETCKTCIGRAAAELVFDGDSIFIGSGSTAAYLARHLKNKKNLTVITNALTVANELASAESATVVVTGGIMRLSELSLIGHITEQSLKEIRVDKIFMGIPAISIQDGLTNDYLHEVMTDRAIIELATELIVVADHTKLEKVCSAFIAPISRVTTLVTDAAADILILEKYKEIGIKVIMADPDSKEIR